MERKIHRQKLILLSAKLAAGGTAAIYIASRLQLQYHISAGTIAILTLMTTKWETVRLSLARLFTFCITVCLAFLSFHFIPNTLAAYCCFIFVLVFLTNTLGWQATISVNAVTGAHFAYSGDFSLNSVFNEFLLVMIGIITAFILNLIQDNQNHRKKLISNMRYTEEQLQHSILDLAAYLSGQEMSYSVWDDICFLEKQLKTFIEEAFEYQENTFHSHPGYYIDYFEMRLNQCHVLHNLHYEMKKIRTMPVQAQIVSQYMEYLAHYVVEMNVPEPQLHRLHQIFQDMKKEHLPKNREEFESRALLYHILMDLEEFLIFKQRFIKGLNSRQISEYWN